MSYAPRHFHLIGAAATGEIRTAKYQGRDHVVVPVVALMEGVIFPVNADTPELVLAQQFSIAPQGWNGRPIFPNHPIENGTQISGNSPKVLESQAIGTIFNARVRNKRLLMDAYLDTNQTSELGKKVLERARRGEMIEVSVGAFVRTSAEKGSFNGKAYKGVWQDIVPDHLAMLPEGTLGACSIAMGCGSHRAAQAAPLHLVTAEGMEQVEDNDSRLTDAAFAHHNFIRQQIQDREEKNRGKGGGDHDEAKHPRDDDGKWTDSPGGGSDKKDEEPAKKDEEKKDDKKKPSFKERLKKFVGAAFRVNDGMSDHDIRNALLEALREREPAVTYVECYYPDEEYVVYCVNSTGNYPGAPYAGERYFERDYAMDKNGEVTLGDERREVERAVVFQPKGEERYAVGNGNNQYKSDNPTKDRDKAARKEERAMTPTLAPVRSLYDLSTKARTDPRYERLAMIAAQNLGGSPKNLDDAMRWLRTNADETDEKGVIGEINFVRDIERTEAGKLDTKRYRGAVGNGNNQYRQDNPTKDEHASGDRTRVDKVFSRTAKSILGAGAKDNFEGGMTWSKNRGYADAKYRAVIAKAEAKGYKEVELNPTHNADGSYMGWDRVLRHKNGSEVRISSSYGPTKDYNSHHITITPPKLRTAEAMQEKEDEEILEPDPEEMDLTEEEQKKRYEMTQAERKSAVRQKYRYNAGRRHSQEDVDMIQEMHDRSVKLGAACAKQEYAVAQRFAQANSQLFDAFKAAIGSTDPELRTAGCGCGGRSSATDDAHSQGDTDMTSKQERIAALISSPKTPFTAADSKMLEAAADERLTALEAHVASLVTAEKKATDTDTALKAASDNITALQTQVTELKAASEKKQTPEEFLAAHPDLKALVDNAKAQEAAHKDALVTSLKTAQSEYTEDELKAMSVNELNRLARVTKATVVQPVMDYAARTPRAAENKVDDAIPAPPSLNAAIKAAAGKQ